MIILETSRLVLKTIEKEDSQVLHDLIFSDEETMKYFFSQKKFSIEETKKFIYQNFCKNNAIIGLAPLFEKKSGFLVGLAGVLQNKHLDKDQCDFCCIIAESFRRKGYATEVMQSEIIFLKKRIRQSKAYALVDKENTISKTILEKLGMSIEKEIEIPSRGKREVYSKKL